MQIQTDLQNPGKSAQDQIQPLRVRLNRLTKKKIPRLLARTTFVVSTFSDNHVTLCRDLAYAVTPLR
jgi:hypothetical protein